MFEQNGDSERLFFKLGEKLKEKYLDRECSYTDGDAFLEKNSGALVTNFGTYFSASFVSGCLWEGLLDLRKFYCI